MDNLPNIRPALVGLNKGKTIEFPIDRLKSVRSHASELGAIYNRTFVTRTDQAARTIIVERKSYHPELWRLYNSPTT